MGKKFVLGAGIFALLGFFAIKTLPSAQQPLQTTPVIQRASAIQTVYSTPTVDINGYIYKGEQTFHITYYNPLRGGKNCDDRCEDTSSGLLIIQNGKPIGDCWFNGKRGCAACPYSLWFDGKEEDVPFGTKIILISPDGSEEIELICQDRGTNEVNGYPNLDILYDDGYRSDNNPFNPPRTRSGWVLQGIYRGRIYFPSNAETQLLPTPLPSSTPSPAKIYASPPSSRYCYSSSLAAQGKSPWVPPGSCPKKGWSWWCNKKGEWERVRKYYPVPGKDCYQR
jgi:hypothetical protein